MSEPNIQEVVKEKYGAAAKQAATGGIASCGGGGELSCCDPITRDMFIRRNQGFSWKEIGEVYSISAHAAESRFGQALQRVRRKLGLGS